MKSHTNSLARQTRLSEWADLIRDCQNCPQGMKIDEWCQLYNITKASYYWRLRKPCRELQAKYLCADFISL